MGQLQVEKIALRSVSPARPQRGPGMRLLLVEDDRAVSNFVKKGLEAEHYAVDAAAHGGDARDLVEEFDYDLVILDLNLPGVDGLDLLAHIRARRPSLPVLVLTVRSRVQDRVKGLDQGADDYLSKPFSFSELSARARALLRRGSPPSGLTLRVGDLEMDRVERKVTRAGQRIELTPKEFALLEYLMRNAGRPVTRAMIVEHVWNYSFDSATNVVDVYINYLRKKVDGGFDLKLIRTVRGVGYQIGAQD